MLNSIQQLQETSAVMQNKLELPPQTTHQVTLKLSSRHEPTIPVLFVPKDHTIQKHQLMIPTCLVSVNPDGQTITVEIANPSLTTQTLHPQQVIGNLANMSDYNIVRPAAQINNLRTLQQETPTTDMIRTQLKQANQHLSTEQSEQLVTLMNKYRDVLALLPTDMGCSTQYTAHLHLHPHSEPVTSRPYPIAHGLQERFDELIENFRQKGIISPSESEYSSPCLLVEKKTLDAQGRRQLRLVTDYRKLNKLIRAPSIRPPKIPDLLHRLKNAKLYTLCDLADAFYQVRIDPESTKYDTAFIAPNGLLWEFNRLPQGLKSSPSLMCRLVALLTADSPNQIAYLDDVMLIAEDFTGMLKEIERFFQKLRHHGLRISLRKCIFAKTEVQYLGFVVSAQGIRPAPSLIEKIKTFPVPQTVKQLQSFLGLANFYRTHIAGYSRVVQPLLSIVKNTSKPNKFVWTNAAQTAFEKLKQLLSTDILLVHPNPRKPYFLHTDASDTAIGAVLSQLDDSNHQRPVAYISKTLSPTEQRYPPIEREAYAIYWAIKKLHVFLYASYQQFHVFTDHQPLKSLFSDKQPISKRLQKWILALQDYNFTLNYVKGKSNVVADCLSRIPKVCQIQSLSTFNGLQDAIDQDPLLSTIKALLSEKSPTHELSKKDQQYVRRHLARYFLDGNTLYFEDDEGRSRLVIPTRYREALLTSNHSTALGGHLGHQKTADKISHFYYWPTLRQDVFNFVNNCEICHKAKIAPRLRPLHKAVKFNEVFSHLAIDLVGPLPPASHGRDVYKYILTAQCGVSKFLFTIPLTETTSATICNSLFNRVFAFAGLPAHIISDNGPQFISQEFREFMGAIGIHLIYTSVYQPSSNFVERAHKTLKQTLTAFVHDKPDLWIDFLPAVTLAINTAAHSTMNESPFYLFFARDFLPPNARIMEHQTTAYMDVIKPVNLTCSAILLAREVAKELLHNSAEQRAENSDKKINRRYIRPGARCYLDVSATKETKFSDPYRGPMRLLAWLSDQNALISDVNRPSERPIVVHASKLKPWPGDGLSAGPSHLPEFTTDDIQVHHNHRPPLSKPIALQTTSTDEPPVQPQTHGYNLRSKNKKS
ncbi:hypothetical protein BOX15_Mlig007858g1 [Macrostomum lignano]|uniref:Reverse transcriptase n=1 Tax=Macrostomum lignano TaxID=282301 RepID=A0A267DUG4_9PLAT|nr:hypothetical protein BOX15_Mlig007858g1 [Macrostomum lignano]